MWLAPALLVDGIMVCFVRAGTTCVIRLPHRIQERPRHVGLFPVGGGRDGRGAERPLRVSVSGDLRSFGRSARDRDQRRDRPRADRCRRRSAHRRGGTGDRVEPARLQHRRRHARRRLRALERAHQRHPLHVPRGRGQRGGHRHPVGQLGRVRARDVRGVLRVFGTDADGNRHGSPDLRPPVRSRRHGRRCDPCLPRR